MCLYGLKNNWMQPNFFIAGAPKCGTATFYHQLDRHP